MNEIQFVTRHKKISFITILHLGFIKYFIDSIVNEHSDISREIIYTLFVL